MGLRARHMILDDYDLICEWWEEWGWEAVPPRAFLPNGGLGGMIVYDDKVPVCAAYMYITNSYTVLVTWYVSNKQYRGKKKRDTAIEYLLSSIEKEAKEAGYRYIYTPATNNNLIDIHAKNGYLKGGTRVTELIKTI